MASLIRPVKLLDTLMELLLSLPFLAGIPRAHIFCKIVSLCLGVHNWVSVLVLYSFLEGGGCSQRIGSS